MEIQGAFPVIETGSRPIGSTLVGRCPRAFLSLAVGCPSPIDSRLCDQYRFPDRQHRSSQRSLQASRDSLGGSSDFGSQSPFRRSGSIRGGFACHPQALPMRPMAGDSCSRSCDLWTRGLVLPERIGAGTLERFQRRGTVPRRHFPPDVSQMLNSADKQRNKASCRCGGIPCLCWNQARIRLTSPFRFKIHSCSETVGKGVEDTFPDVNPGSGGRN